MVNDFLNISLEDFHFLRPLFLWLFIPSSLAIIFGLMGLQEEVKWRKVIAPHLRPYIIKKGSENRRKRMQLFAFIFQLIAIFGISGPTWNKVEVPGKTLETPLVIILDLSQSMMATDIQPNRLERAKFKIYDLLDANPRARIALVGFSGTAHTIIPLTNDYKIIKSHLDGLSPTIMPFPGSNLGNALEVADTITKITNVPGTILLLTDDFDDTTYELLQGFVLERKTKIEILPFNTDSGANIPSPDSKSPLRNKQGEIVHSALNKNILHKLNSLESINVNRLTLDKSDIELLATTIRNNLEFTEQEEEKEDDWQDMGFWLIIPFAIFVLMWFRKGWVIYSLAVFVTLSSCSNNINFNDLWYSKNYQAQKIYDRGDFEQAAVLFTDPLYKGVAYYKSGNYKEAIKSFSEDTTAMGTYNLGLAYYKNGDFSAAEIAFGMAVEMNPELGDAKTNQKLIQQIIEANSETDFEEAKEFAEEQTAENIENKDMEDLGGGGQEATKEDMEKERKEETTNTDIRKGKELDEVPDNIEFGKQENSQKVLMRKVDDDPALFLRRKFAHQVKTKNLQPINDGKEW